MSEELDKMAEDLMTTGLGVLRINPEEMIDNHTHEFDIYAQALDCMICSICGIPENGDE